MKGILSEEMITPVFDTFMGLLSAVSGPLIFLSVAGGIYNIGDIIDGGYTGTNFVITLALRNLDERQVMERCP